MKNLCICGWKGSGKSRAAERLAKNGYTVKKFATPLKRIISNALVVDDIESNKESFYMYDGGDCVTAVVGDESRAVDTQYLIDTSKAIVMGVLMELGMTDFGARMRVEEPSVYKSPVKGFDGLTPEKMVLDVFNMLSKLIVL